MVQYAPVLCHLDQTWGVDARGGLPGRPELLRQVRIARPYGQASPGGKLRNEPKHLPFPEQVPYSCDLTTNTSAALFYLDVSSDNSLGLR